VCCAHPLGVFIRLLVCECLSISPPKAHAYLNSMAIVTSHEEDTQPLEEGPKTPRISIAPDSPVNQIRKETEIVYDSDWTVSHKDMRNLQKKMSGDSYVTTHSNPSTPLSRRTIPLVSTACRHRGRSRLSDTRLTDMRARPDGRETIPSRAHRNDFRTTAKLSDRQMDEYLSVDTEAVERSTRYIRSNTFNQDFDFRRSRPSLPTRVCNKVLRLCRRLRGRPSHKLTRPAYHTPMYHPPSNFRQRSPSPSSTEADNRGTTQCPPHHTDVHGTQDFRAASTHEDFRATSTQEDFHVSTMIQGEGTAPSMERRLTPPPVSGPSRPHDGRVSKSTGGHYEPDGGSSRHEEVELTEVPHDGGLVRHEEVELTEVPYEVDLVRQEEFELTEVS